MQHWKPWKQTVYTVVVGQVFPAHMFEYHTPHGDEVHLGPQRSLTKCFWSYIEMVLSSSMMPCLCRCVKPYDMKWTFCWSMDKCGIANPIHMRRALCIMTFGWLGIFEAACCIFGPFFSHFEVNRFLTTWHFWHVFQGPWTWILAFPMAFWCIWITIESLTDQETTLDFKDVRLHAPTFNRMENDEGLLRVLRRLPVLQDLSMQHLRLLG